MDIFHHHLTRRQALIAGGGVVGMGAAAASVAAALPALAGEPRRVAPADPGSMLPVNSIEQVFGVKGKLEPGGVLHIDLDRQDLHPVAFGIPLKVDIGFDTEITFQPLDKGALVKWEFVLLDSEVDPVLSALFSEKLQPAKTNVNAIHNHFLELTPKIKFVHGTACGDPVQVARALRQALQHSHQPFVSSSPGKTGLPNQQITQIIGGTGMISDSVLSVSVERKETIRELGITLKPAMQIESTFNFQATSNGQAAVNAEFVLLAPEVDAVARTLRAHGLSVMAIHNHELFIEPTLYYLHSFASGEPLTLAHALRDALNKTNSKFQQAG